MSFNDPCELIVADALTRAGIRFTHKLFTEKPNRPTPKNSTQPPHGKLRPPRKGSR